jgi:hypothetical protein
MEADLLKKFHSVYSGHFHYRQDNGHMYYLGTQYELTWNDYGQTKGFHVLDTDTGETEFIENPHKIFIKEFYNDEADDYTDPPVDHFKDKYVRLVVVKKNNPYLFERFVDAIYEAGPSHVQVIEDVSEYEIDDDDMVNIAEDTLTILSNYIDQLPTKDDKDRLKSIMRELYTESLFEE